MSKPRIRIGPDGTIHRGDESSPSLATHGSSYPSWLCSSGTSSIPVGARDVATREFYEADGEILWKIVMSIPESNWSWDYRTTNLLTSLFSCPRLRMFAVSDSGQKVVIEVNEYVSKLFIDHYEVDWDYLLEKAFYVKRRRFRAWASTLHEYRRRPNVYDPLRVILSRIETWINFFEGNGER